MSAQPNPQPANPAVTQLAPVLPIALTLPILEEVKSHAQTHWTNQPTGDTQNSEMMYHFLFKSLGDSFKATILLQKNNYMMMVENYTTKDDPCLLKQIIISTFVDTRATVAQIRESLVDMAQQLEEQKGNITKFNEWVEDQVSILQLQSEEAHDLLTYLWKTYQKVPDIKFVEYIHGLQNDYITSQSDFTAQELMNLADTMYKAWTQITEWSSLSTEQEEIMTLNAKIAHLDKQLEQANKNKTKTKEENKSKKKSNDKDREWMKEKPKGDENKVKGYPT